MIEVTIKLDDARSVLKAVKTILPYIDRTKSKTVFASAIKMLVNAARSHSAMISEIASKHNALYIKGAIFNATETGEENQKLKAEVGTADNEPFRLKLNEKITILKLDKYPGVSLDALENLKKIGLVEVV